MATTTPPDTGTSSATHRLTFESMRRWAQENLFSSGFNSILTVLTTGLVLVLIRGLLSFILSPERKWGSVTHNMRLYMVFAYPEEEIFRVWVSLGVIVTLAALSIAAWDKGRRVTPSAATRPMSVISVFVLFGSLLTPRIDLGTRLAIAGVAVILLAAAFALRRLLNSTSSGSVSIVSVIGTIAALFVSTLWVIRLPVPIQQSGRDLIEEFQPLERSTTVPWSLILVAGFAAFYLGTLIRRGISQKAFKQILVGAWILSYPLLVFVILRNPVVDMDLVVRDLGIGIGLAVIGGLVLYAMAVIFPDRRRMRTVGGLLAVAVAGIVLVVSIERIVSIPLVLFALFAIVAPSFSTSPAAARRVAVAWAAIVLTLVFFMSAMSMELGIFTGKKAFLGGFMLTLTLAIGGVLPGFLLSIPLALGRMSKLPIIRQVCIAYIELVRAVPLIVWLFMGVNLLALFVPAGFAPDVVLRVAVVFTFFWAAYLAENVRGGLQAISKGQVEAAEAIGLTPTQVTALIVLPQALRLVIPPIVGQVITSFKDTSLVAIIGVFELLNVAHRAVPTQTDPFSFIGTQKENFLFVAAIYFVFTFSMSKASQRLERKLGVGER